ncbi:MAG: DnaJ domain-containing protein [Burkholderiales bacterium]
MEPLYDILEVSRTASPEVIRAAYKSLVQRFHPDKNPDNPDAEEMLKRINHAYDILSDPEERAAYDVMLTLEEMPAPEVFSRKEEPEEAAVPVENAPDPSGRKLFKRPALVIAGACAIALIAFGVVFFMGEKAKPQAASPPALKPLAGIAPPRPQPVAPPAPAGEIVPKPAAVSEPEPAPVAIPAPIKPVEKRTMPRPEPKVLPRPQPVLPPPVAAIPQARPPAEVSKYADLASAVSSGDRVAVEKMIKGGEDVNLVRGNQVPLIIAVKNGDAAMVKLLISHGADVNLTDNQGNTAMIYAKVRADANMIEILKNAGAKNPFD